MSRKAARAVISALILIGVFSVVLYATMRNSAQPYKHVDEVAANPQAWYGRSMQLHGFAESIQVRPSTLDYRFEVQNNGQVIKAVYTGVVPDTFKDGAEVVVKGRMGPDGFVVEPNGVMAKCPSRYEAARSAGQ
jgi:cytochrome c-type biogenesis protein CcmE